MTIPRSQEAAPPDFLDYALLGCGAKRDAATADAFRRAGTLIDAGRAAEALAMLDYAQRLAPDDGGISLAIGLLRLNLGDPRACEPFERLAGRTDWRDIRMALARVRMKFGQIERAAADLHMALSLSGPPVKHEFLALADAVCKQSGAAGWCALGNDGRVVLGAARSIAVGLSILLDGVKIADDDVTQTRGRHAVALPAGWQRGRRLDVLLRGRALLGSPIDVGAVARVEGFVAACPDSGALEGWCWFPAERERAPMITVAALADPRHAVSFRALTIDPSLTRGDEFGFPYRFLVTAKAAAALGEAVAVTGPHGQALYGSPLWPRAGGGASRRAARRRQSVPTAQPVPAWPVDIVIPVFAGRDITLACIDAVGAQLVQGERIIVVADASPDVELIAALTDLAERGRILLQVETVNRGFPGAANIGLRLAAGHDAVLLNSDTVVTPRWLARLRAAAHSASDIGTATPLSNDATIFSYPRPDTANRFPARHEADALAAIAAEANTDETVDVPTGHGFCLYIRAECLAETGLLREDLFAQGCGEENDFCLRARHLGWRHVAVPGAFVAHHGSHSFNAARDDLLRRNLATLNRLHPGYDALIAGWQARDPLHPARRRIDLARLRRATAGRQGVLLVTHDRAGGVRRHVSEQAAAIARDGDTALVLRPANTRDTDGRIAEHAVLLDTGFDDAYPNLRFRLPAERAALADVLRSCALRMIAVHSLIGHHDSLIDLLREQPAPLEVAIHDYAWFCPRITLTAVGHRYCGEPAIAGCRDCVAGLGTNLDEDIAPEDLLMRSRRLFDAARTILAPSEDTARRIRSHFAGIDVTVRPWETAAPPAPRAIAESAGRTRPVRVCVVGAIGPEKGYDTLLACARTAAASGMPLEFVVIGHTSDDRRLLDTGVVRITGRYDEAEAVELIRAQHADLAWLPAAWPETWSYVLTLVWQAALPAIVHDIGAPAERVRSHGGGRVVPLNLPPERLVALFLDPGLFRPAPIGAAAKRPPVAMLTAPTSTSSAFRHRAPSASQPRHRSGATASE